VIESRQNRQRLRPYLLYVVLVGRNLHQRGADFVQLRRVTPAQTGKRGAARLERSILIAPNVEEPGCRINIVAEESGKDCVMTDAPVGAGGDTKQIVRCLGGCNGAEIRNAGVYSWRHPTNVRAERYDILVRQIEHDPDWACLTLIRGIGRERAIEIARPGRDVGAAIAADSGTRRKAELHRPVSGRRNLIRERLPTSTRRRREYRDDHYGKVKEAFSHFCL
jgi:hypothetical protein